MAAADLEFIHVGSIRDTGWHDHSDGLGKKFLYAVSGSWLVEPLLSSGH